MAGSLWDPMPDGLSAPEWDLVVQLRYLLDVAGLGLEQLGADGDFPYSPHTMRRALSGQLFPSRDMLDVVADRCDADPAELYELYERAARARSARREAPRPSTALPGGYERYEPYGQYGRPQPPTPSLRPFHPGDGPAAPEWGPAAAPEWAPSAGSGWDRHDDGRAEAPDVDGTDEDEFWAPIEGEPEDLRISDILRPPERPEVPQPVFSGTRPTVIALVLLTSFAVGIVLVAALRLGGEPENVSRTSRPTPQQSYAPAP